MTMGNLVEEEDHHQNNNIDQFGPFSTHFQKDTVLKNQNNNMAIGNIENRSAELQDKLKPLDEDMKIGNFGPSLEEDGIILPVTSFSTFFKKNEEIYLQNAWPTVKSALEDYGISCALNLVEGSMTVSTTTKTRDPDIIEKAKELTELLSLSVPADEAIRILDAKMKCDFIEIGTKRGGLCVKYGIDMEQFRERWERFLGPKNTGLKTIQHLTGCSVFFHGNFTVAVIGKFEGLKMVRRIVVDCIRNKMRPSVHIRRLRMNQNEHKLTKKLFDQGGYRSIMEASVFMKTSFDFHEHISTKFVEALHQIQDSDVEAIADKFRLSTCGIILRQLMPCYLGDEAAMCCLLKIQSRGSQQGSNSMEHGRNSQFSLRLRMVTDLTKMDSLEVHVDAAETLCAITRLAPPGLATKICNPSFIQRLLQHAMEDSQRKSVLTSSLSVCISLLDREREALRTNACTGEHQPAHGSTITVNNKIVVAMLDSLGDLLKLLDVSSADNMLLTTYGKLQPPLGKHRLKIVEFISVLLSVRSQAAEKELIRIAAIQKVLDLFFKYPYNNFLHHHIENIIVSCLESKNGPLVQHLLCECDLVGKILEAEKNFTLAADSFMPTIPAKGRSPPRNGNIGHLTCISNKIIQLGNNNREIQAYLQENSVWTEWHTEVLLKRNAVENVSQWACGRPISSLDRGRSS
ncbi:uncharacterized protein LOC133732134 isoform X2 [Rosa rugosa]|uniref:uncharacterized protein LOC133732134 isoform X2 n=1 Tax=Rosa rugosa TaxID=74645 RepID=UPI002B406FC1|nr:uncharacterized protein LOC133732134 isoform X2 [Rosa rugosa]